MKLNEYTKHTDVLKRLYHASNDKFDIFDLEYVGKSNNQQYGWGIYFSPNRDDTYQYIQDNGYIYEITLDPAVEDNLLDWNNTLNNQLPKVKQTLLSNSREIERIGYMNTPLEELFDIQTGESLYKILSTGLRGSRQASEYLDTLGIYGIIHRPFLRWSGSKQQHYTIFNKDALIIKSRKTVTV